MAKYYTPEQRVAQKKLLRAERAELALMVELELEPSAEKQTELLLARRGTDAALMGVIRAFFGARRK